MTKEKIIEMMELSEGFRNVVWNDAYEQTQFELEWAIKDYSIEGIEFKDHYSSFYIHLTDREKFVESIKELYPNEASAIKEELEILEHLELLENLCSLNDMEVDYTVYNKVDKKIDKMVNELLNKYEESLHSIEHEYDNVTDYLAYLEDTEQLEDWYNDYSISNGKVYRYHPAYNEKLD